MRQLRCFILPVANLHADWPVMEVWLNFAGRERALFEQARAARRGQLVALWQRVAGVEIADANPMPRSLPDAAGLMADLTLALQRAAGHAVGLTAVLEARADADIRFVVEYDHADVAQAASRLARELLETWLQSDSPDAPVIAELERSFLALQAEAAGKATPADARALIAAAIDLGIPWYRMDREPFDPIRGEFRLRRHGLLRFGHGRHRRTLDGVFCVERLERWHGLVRRRSARLAWLRQSGLPVCATQAAVCLGTSRARRLFARLEGPLWVEGESGDGLIEAVPMTDRGQLAAAAERLQHRHTELLVGKAPTGQRLDVLWIGGAVRGARAGSRVLALDGSPALSIDVGVLCERLAGMVQTGCLSVALVESAEGWQILDFDLNPRLERWTSDGQALDQAAVALLTWLFPDGRDGRIPIIAVTGTNGKTTTCHMIESILRGAGWCTGVATSLGSQVNGNWISELEDGFLPGHLSVLGHPEVDVAILESTRGGARSVGLGFDHCALATCLNVAADHLDDELGLRSVEELAELKRWIAWRARRGVVLNHDDASCRAMIERAGDRPVTLVSVTRGAAALADSWPQASAFFTVESCRGSPWIAVTDSGGTRPLVAVHDIPLTLDGRAAYNTSNAAHAAALCALLGVDDRHIAAGLEALRPDFECMPGRLNLHQVGDFRVLFDYAHNPHGVEAVMAAIERMPVQGRRRVNFSVSGLRSDNFVREVAARVAGRFDHYVCTNYAALYGRPPGAIPGILRAELLARGVEESRIEVVADADAAVQASLESARPGDLVVFLVGKTLRAQWKLIERFGTVTPVDPATIGAASAPAGNA